MKMTPIRNWKGIIIGWYENRQNGDIFVRDSYKRILGRYDKSMDVTRDFSGRIIGHGNLTAMLLPKDK